MNRMAAIKLYKIVEYILTRILLIVFSETIGSAKYALPHQMRGLWNRLDHQMLYDLHLSLMIDRIPSMGNLEGIDW